MAITYTPTTNFGAKDSLPTNDPDKVIKGSEFTTEFTAIQTAFGLAAPAASPTFTGTVTIASVDINGGTIDGVTIGGSSAGAITGTTGQFNTSLNVDGTVTADGLTTGGNIFFDSTSGALRFRTTEGVEKATARLATNDLKIETSGFARALFAVNGDISFYEDTGTTAKFFWDASAESLGIGTTSPSSKLSIAAGDILLDNTRSIIFKDSGGTARGILQYYSDNSTYLDAPNGSTIFRNGASNTEKMRITLDGNLLVGTTQTPATLITTSTTSHAGVGIADGYLSIARDLTGSANSGGVAFLNRLATDGPIADFRKDGTTVGSIGTTGGDLMIGQGAVGVRFLDSTPSLYPTNITSGATADASIDIGTSAARFKDLYLSGGVYLGGTGAANKLDDYEEGTFTPVLLASAVNPSVTYGTRIGKYTKVGNVVNVYISLSTSAFSGGSGDLWVSGLPFAASQDASGGAPMFYRVNSFTETAPYVNSGASYVVFLGRDDTDTSTAWSIMQTSSWTAANPTITQFSITYFTAS